MANEFVAKNGLISQNNTVVSGSLTVTQGSLVVTGSTISTGGFTGSLFGTSSWANNAVTSSYILNAISSSFASTASFITPVNAGLAGLPYTAYNLPSAVALSQIVSTSIDFNIGTSQLRNGSLVVLQGYMSRTGAGTGTVTFSWTANSFASSSTQTYTSATQYGIQFYWTAKYLSGSDSLRFFRTPTTSFVVNNTVTPTSFDVPSSSSAFTINFRAIVAPGSMTGATENVTCQIIY